jgi:hypothetical protein
MRPTGVRGNQLFDFRLAHLQIDDMRSTCEGSPLVLFPVDSGHNSDRRNRSNDPAVDASSISFVQFRQISMPTGKAGCQQLCVLDTLIQRIGINFDLEMLGPLLRWAEFLAPAPNVGLDEDEELRQQLGKAFSLKPDMPAVRTKATAFGVVGGRVDISSALLCWPRR